MPLNNEKIAHKTWIFDMVGVEKIRKKYGLDPIHMQRIRPTIESHLHLWFRSAKPCTFMVVGMRDNIMTVDV